MFFRDKMPNNHRYQAISKLLIRLKCLWQTDVFRPIIFFLSAYRPCPFSEGLG